MPLSARQLICVVVLCGTALAAVTTAPWHQVEPTRVAIHVARDTQHARWFAVPDYTPVLGAIDFVTATNTAALFASIDDELARAAELVHDADARAIGGLVASIPAAVPQRGGTLNTGTGKAAAGGGPPQASGGHSDAWWAAIAQCESGTTNGWRTGYFGLEGRPGISALSYGDQLGVARWVWSWAGDGAWACSPRAYAAVPGG